MGGSGGTIWWFRGTSEKIGPFGGRIAMMKVALSLFNRNYLIHYCIRGLKEAVTEVKILWILKCFIY